MKIKTFAEIDELPRNKLTEYVDVLHEYVDKIQREIADSVRYELDIKFSYDALNRKYKTMLIETSQMLIETYNVDRITASQIIREIDQHAASEAATYPRGGCSG